MHTDRGKSGPHTWSKANQERSSNRERSGITACGDRRGGPSYITCWDLLSVSVILENTPEIVKSRLRTSTFDDDCGRGNGMSGCILVVYQSTPEVIRGLFVYEVQNDLAGSIRNQ